MKRLLLGFAILFALIIAASLGVPHKASGQAKGFNFFDTTQYPNTTPVGTGVIIWGNSGVAKTTTFAGLMAAGLDITGNPVRLVGSGKNTILASVAATADKTMTFPNVTGNVVSTGDTGTVTNAMLTGSIAASKLVGTDIATVGTITSGTWTGTTVAIANGGTGNTTAANAINALLPTQTSNSGKFLTTNGTVGSWATVPGASYLQPTRLTANVTNATATMSNLTDLSQTLTGATAYVGRIVIIANNSTGAEGLQFDFSGGSATMTSFQATVEETPIGATLGTTNSTALGTALSDTVVSTTDSVYAINLTMAVNMGGTFIPRFAEVSHATGTATAKVGSRLNLQIPSN